VSYYKNDYNERGYDKNKRPRFDNRYPRKKPQGSFPSPSALRAYEEVSEGSADRLIEMAEIEQNHRHDWENSALIAYSKSYRFGQFCGMMVAIAVVYGALYAAKELHDQKLACIIAISGFASLMVSTIFAARTKRYESRFRKSPHREERKYNSADDANEKIEE
jgi:uncharacterized membrane protein